MLHRRSHRKMILRLSNVAPPSLQDCFNPRKYKSCFTFLLLLSFICVFVVFSNRTQEETTAFSGSKPCKPISSAELLRVRTTRNGIPLILHQVYRNTRLPSAYRPFIDNCRRLNPEFVHVLWTDADVDAFLRRERPELQELLSRYTIGVEKADVMRLMLMHHFGGVYLDFDVDCRRPLIPALDKFNQSCIFDREREEQTVLIWHNRELWMNSAMMCRRKHPVFIFLLKMLPLFQADKRTVYRTGPLFITKIMNIFRSFAPVNDSVFLAPSFAFSPMLDREKIDNFVVFCAIARYFFVSSMKPYFRSMCNRLVEIANSPALLNNATLEHAFLHLGYRDKQRGRSFDACQLPFRRYAPAAALPPP